MCLEMAYYVQSCDSPNKLWNSSVKVKLTGLGRLVQRWKLSDRSGKVTYTFTVTYTKWGDFQLRQIVLSGRNIMKCKRKRANRIIARFIIITHLAALIKKTPEKFSDKGIARAFILSLTLAMIEHDKWLHQVQESWKTYLYFLVLTVPKESHKRHSAEGKHKP